MSDKPPPYNPNLYDGPSPYPPAPAAYPPPPPPPPYYQQQPPPPQPIQTTFVTGMQQPGGSTTIVTGVPHMHQPVRGTTIISGASYGTIGQPMPVVVQAVPATSVLLVGGCPSCRVGVLNEEFTLGGLCCAFWFFPIGLLCCLAMRERRCTNCHASY